MIIANRKISGITARHNKASFQLKMKRMTADMTKYTIWSIRNRIQNPHESQMLSTSSLIRAMSSPVLRYRRRIEKES